ncbi:hypothetical protein SAMN04487910_1293 [Aquimarina amphilecti]|uniref:Cip1-like core domain-containing protein n=2 Tax=Aquimarina amphilecti TaxID=1038014 RepID=A0A1H7KGM0_AQUAM|nr:hypothetical protein SAMN04487910_1293 [Aquimarina amphilecti]
MLLVLFTLLSCNKTKSVLYQDNFETYLIGETPGDPWKKTGNGIVVIDNARSFSGTKSVHFITGEGYKNRAFLGIDHVFPLKDNAYYGSLKMYVQNASPDGIHWTMIQSSGKVKGEDYSSEIRYGGQHNKQLMANYETQGVKSDCWKHSNIKIPEDKWFVLQWYFNGNQDKMQLWLDGESIASLTVVGSGEGCVENGTNGQWKFPVIENVLLGWVDYQIGGGTPNIWIDDVIISLDEIDN